MAAGTNTAEIGFEQKIWAAADALRGNMVASEYKLIPVSLWLVSRDKRQRNKTLFIDARKMGTMVSRRLREMTADDISRIAATFEAFGAGTLEDAKGYCAVATTEEIAKQGYILTPGRYVGIEEQEDDGEPFEEKMARLTGELSEMFKRSHELQRLGAIGFGV